jgi:hypothetical protein
MVHTNRYGLCYELRYLRGLSGRGISIRNRLGRISSIMGPLLLPNLTIFPDLFLEWVSIIVSWEPVCKQSLRCLIHIVRGLRQFSPRAVCFLGSYSMILQFMVISVYSPDTQGHAFVSSTILLEKRAFFCLERPVQLLRNLRE